MTGRAKVACRVFAGLVDASSSNLAQYAPALPRRLYYLFGDRKPRDSTLKRGVTATNSTPRLRATPVDVARRIARRRAMDGDGGKQREPVAPSTIEDLETSLRVLCPELPWLLKQLGVSSVPHVIQQWVARRDHNWVQELLSVHTTGNAIAEKWRIHLERLSRTDELVRDPMILVEELVFEYWLSYRAASVSQSLSRRFQYDKTLHVSRQHVALCLYNEAREVTWRRPFVFTRALQIAHTYLRDITDNANLTNPDTRYQFAGRLGVAVILVSRFEPVSEVDLREAVEVLLSSVAQGNPALDAVPYILEGMIRLYDLCGEIETLQRAVALDRSYSTDVVKSAAWYLDMAEIWLRLADEGSTSTGQKAFLSKAKECVDFVEKIGLIDAVDKARYHVARALCVAFDKFAASKVVSPLRIRGLKNPFGLYEHIFELGSSVDSPLSTVNTVIGALRAATTLDTEPIIRRVFADVLSARTLDSALTNSERIALLQEALRVRRGRDRYSQLDDDFSRFGTARDLLLLARLQADERGRVEGLRLLVIEAVSDELSCIPLVMLGQDMENNGPLGTNASAKLQSFLSGSSAESLVEDIVSNRVDSVYAEAARRAILSPDLARRRLGGRGNAVTTEDYQRLSNEVFVFKATSHVCYNRELARTRELTAWINDHDLGEIFGFVEHLAQTEADQDDPMFNSAADVLTVRRFRFGLTLADAMQMQPARTSDLMAAASRFLAIIHAFETARAGEPTGVRKELLRKEFGWWLRDGLKAEDAAQIFGGWWNEVGSIPVLSRRDAHAFNWLVSGTDKILAIDLEATGWRPAGYELAQLTDDVPAFPVSNFGWNARRKIVELYVSTLAEFEYSLTYSEVWRAYTASLIARAVRGLTDPTGDERLRSHAEQLLRSISEEPTVTNESQLLAREILNVWAQRLGISEHQVLPRMGPGRRRRISRALAYYLRHDPNIHINEQGWVSAEGLSEAFGASGLRVPASEILSVASAVDEPRFEVREPYVRAQYGHSRPVDIDYDSPTPPVALYHSTVMATLNAIFQEGQGVRPMTRQWVHLSARWDLALRAGRRHGPPVLLALNPAEHPALTFFSAGGTTWLAPAIDEVALHVVPIFRVFVWNQEKQ